MAAGLAGCAIGERVVVLEHSLSTMDAVGELDAAASGTGGLPDGAVVLADHQSAGRGRLGRAWLAEPGQALMLSVCFRPVGLPPDRLSQVAMAVAMGALTALRLRLPPGAAAALKWPNDLLVDGRKIGGLLSELTWEPGGPRLTVGLGLNVRQRTFPNLPEATSLALCLGGGTGAAADLEDPRLDRAALALDLLRAASVQYAALRAGEDLVGLWASELETVGRRVSVRPLSLAMDPAEPIHGLARGVAPDGALEILTDDGRILLVRAGDVTLSGGGGERH